MIRVCILTAVVMVFHPAVAHEHAPVAQVDAPVLLQTEPIANEAEHPAPALVLKEQDPELKKHTPVRNCPWDELDIRSRAAVWSKLTPRHRDYHWRLMTHEERSELRRHLSKDDNKALRERFVMRNRGELGDQPYILYKRLNKAELSQLRQQIREAQRQQLFANMLKTPAQIEHESQFLSSQAKFHDQTHQMLIITIQDNGADLSNLSKREEYSPREMLPNPSNP